MTPRSSRSSALRTASMPSTSSTSTRWLLWVRVWSTSGWFSTSSRFTPSVSSIHSWSLVYASASSNRGRVLDRMNTLRMSATPRSFSWVSMLLSMRFRNTSSSDPAAASSFAASSSFTMRMRSSSFSALSSVKMQVRSP